MEEMFHMAGTGPRRSTFVTVTAWVVIVFAVLTMVGTLLQGVVLQLLISAGRFGELEHGPLDALPGLGGVVTVVMRAVVLGLLAVSVFTLVTAVGLLRRRNWARIVFIVFLVVGIVQNALGIVANYFMLSAAPGEGGLTGTPLDAVMPAMWVVTVVTGVGFIALFGWMIRKLTSEPIRAEFRVERRPFGDRAIPGSLSSGPRPGGAGPADGPGSRGGLGW